MKEVKVLRNARAGCKIYLKIRNLLRKEKLNKKICCRQLMETVMSQDIGPFSRFLPIIPASSECLPSYSLYYQEDTIRNIYKDIRKCCCFKSFSLSSPWQIMTTWFHDFSPEIPFSISSE